jgi:hypothetical protein
LVDNQIIEILWDDLDLDWDYDANFVEWTNSPTYSNNLDEGEISDEDLSEIQDNWNTSEYYDDGIKTEPYINTFEEFCEEYSAKIFYENNKKYCLIEGKVCLSSDYKNWVCKLSEKK